MDISKAKKNRILALETTGMIASVAIAEFADGNFTPVKLIEKESLQQRNHLTELMPMVRDSLSEAGLTLSEIDVIAASAGPGSFTGMRIGISTARALAQVENIPVIKVPTFETFVFASDGIICPISDARLSQLYSGVFALSENSRGVSKGLVSAEYENQVKENIVTYIPVGAYNPEEFFIKLSETLSGKSLTIFGDGLVAFQKEIDEWCKSSGVEVVLDEKVYQKASYVANWAYAFGQPIDYSGLEPIYIRKAEAQRKLDEGLLEPKA